MCIAFPPDRLALVSSTAAVRRIQPFVERPTRSENMPSKHYNAYDAELSCLMMRAGIIGGVASTLRGVQPSDLRSIEPNFPTTTPSHILGVVAMVANMPDIRCRDLAARRTEKS
jgi:hypothetical protein